MKKIKLANSFLTVNKVLSIVCVVLYAIGLVLTPILIELIFSLAKEMEEITPDVQEILDLGKGVAIAAVIIAYAFALAFAIVGLCFTVYAKKHANKATSRKEITKPAVFAIIAGALTGVFGIPAGILLLTTKDADYQTVEVEAKEIK